MTTRSKGKLKIWLFDECILDAIQGSKPPTSKIVYLHFRCLHSELQDEKNGTATARNSAKIATEKVKQWWLCKAAIPTKSDNSLINMILNIHKDWTTLFKQCLKTTQQQLDKREAFVKEMQKIFWAPKPNCEKELNDEDKQFLSNMKGSREGGVSSLDRVIMAKSKRKMETVLQIGERKQKEKKKRKLTSEVIPSSVIEKYEDSESNLSSNAGEDTDLYLPKPSKKGRKRKKRPVVSLGLNPTEWSKIVSIVADKHYISHRGITEVMSAVMHSGGGSINDLSLLKDTV